MKAAFLKAFGSPLIVETMPDPVLGTGEVIVDVVATRVLSYANEVFSGERKYLLDLPVVPGPGGIGRVRAVGPDATHLAVGDWVTCDPTAGSRDAALSPDITLQGWSAGGDGGLRLQQYFRHGSFAERVRVPTENAIGIGALDAAKAARWCALGTLLVPYGGLLAVDFQAGETLLVSGAGDLARRFGPRLRPATLSGDEADDRERMRQAAPGPIDCMLDLLPPAASATAVRAAAMAVRPYGRVVLMGGVDMQGGSGLELPYPWITRNCIIIRGQWMYPREATARLVGLMRSGLLDLGQFAVTSFALDDVNEAIAHAAAHAGPFKMTVIRPDHRAVPPAALAAERLLDLGALQCRGLRRRGRSPGTGRPRR